MSEVDRLFRILGIVLVFNIVVGIAVSIVYSIPCGLLVFFLLTFVICGPIMWGICDLEW